MDRYYNLRFILLSRCSASLRLPKKLNAIFLLVEKLQAEKLQADVAMQALRGGFGLNSTDLKFFVAAYEARSFSGATESLGTVHSNVAARIRKLERSLGVALFVRAHRTVVPTQEGEVLYQHAKNVMATLAETERAVRTLVAA